MSDLPIRTLPAPLRLGSELPSLAAPPLKGKGIGAGSAGLGVAQPWVSRAALSPARRPSVTAVHRPIAGR